MPAQLLNEAGIVGAAVAAVEADVVRRTRPRDLETQTVDQRGEHVAELLARAPRRRRGRTASPAR